MSFNIGDVVVLSTRKGAVQYTVTDIPVPGEQITIKSENSGKETVVAPSRLTLVHSDFLSDAEIETEIAEQADTRDDDVDFSKMPALIPVPETEIMAPWEIELLHGGVNPGRPFLLTVDGVISDHKSYGAACDALIIAARDGFKHYAVIDHAGERKATRTAA
jgi:hypothetical protein